MARGAHGCRLLAGGLAGRQPLGLAGVADRLDAEVDELDRGRLVGVAVYGAVSGVEQLRQLAQTNETAVGEADGDLKGLSLVAEVRRADQLAGRRRYALLVQPGQGL